MGGNVSTASPTPAGGWYADPLDASLLRWWDGATWTKQTMPADAALGASDSPASDPVPAPPLLTAVPRPDEPYVPPNSVFKLADSAGDAYVPEWSGLADISPEVALSGVPVQLALTSTPSEPPIPVSADVFPMLRTEEPAVAEKEPAWRVEAPLAAPIDQLFPANPAVAPVAPVAPEASAAAVTPVAAAAVAPVVPVAPVAPVAPAAPVAPVAPAAGPSLSADIFPVSGPAAPAEVPQPIGESFPGIVPTVATPVEPIAEPAAAEAAMLATLASAQVSPPAPVVDAVPVVAPVPVAPVPVAPVPVAPVPVAEPTPIAVPMPAAAPVPQPVAPQPVAPHLVAPQAVFYTGPAPVEVATNPVAPPDFQPFAASTPGATYTPVAPRPIPQPLQLSAPTAAPTGSAGSTMGAELVPATPYVLQSAPGEYWPTQGTPPPGTQYQPNPGNYVPFDPSSVHLEPVPVIPFSSRDPYNSASTARPGMRAYAAAPVGPSGSTWTGGLAFMLLAPLISAAAYFGWIQLVASATISNDTFPYIAGILGVIAVLSLASAQFDRNALAKRGYFDLASPFWVLLVPPLIYLIVRATRLNGQGRGAPLAIVLSVLSSIAGSAVVVFALTMALTAPTAERVGHIQSSIEASLAAKNIKATVSCPAVPSLAPGANFVCTATTASATLPLRVTIVDWTGEFTVASTSSSGSTS
jgi:hypothetical protein